MKKITMEQGKLYFKTYLADYCALTRRYFYSMGGQGRYYDKNYVSHPENRLKRRTKGIQTEAPKWARYCFYGKEKIQSIPVYEKPIWLLAVQEKNTRFIVGAQMKQKLDSRGGKYPTWFDSRPLLQQVLKKHGTPYGLIADGTILNQHHNPYGNHWLDGIQAIERAESYSYIASLESFFRILQRNMRTDLTQENLDAFVHHWNHERKLRAFGKTPSQLMYELELIV
jgi:hypothetical protein